MDDLDDDVDPDLDNALEVIEAAFEADDLVGALELLLVARKRFPKSPEVHWFLGDAFSETGELYEARIAYQVAAALAPDMPEVIASLAWIQFQLADFDMAQITATRSNEIHANAAACSLLGRLAERRGDLEEADRCAQRAHLLDDESYPLPCRVSDADLRSTVVEALDKLPEEFRRALEGEVAILVEPVPSLEILRSEDPPLDPEILGLYVGVPLPEREATMLAAKLPDVVYLFHHNLEHDAADRAELLDQISVTVYHEIGHYLGYDDDALEERGFG